MEESRTFVSELVHEDTEVGWCGKEPAAGCMMREWRVFSYCCAVVKFPLPEDAAPAAASSRCRRLTKKDRLPVTLIEAKENCQETMIGSLLCLWTVGGITNFTAVMLD